MRLVQIAARNLIRHTRRTVITVLAIALGLALMVWSNNLAYGIHNDMVRAGISQLAGDVVVQAEGYQKERDQELLVTGASAVAGALQERFPDATVVRRSFLQGLVSSPRNSVGIGITAVDPSVETRVSDWHEKLVEGEFLADAERGIVLGVRLAETLEVEVGDKVVVMAQGADEVTSRLYRVDGLLRTGSEELDGFFALVPIGTTAELLGEDDAVTQVSVHQERSDADAVRQAAAAALSGRDDLEVLTWEEALPELVQFIRLDDAGNHVFMGVIGVIVAMGVLNTVLMSVMERVREFGVMLALGVTPRQVASVVLFEGIAIGVLSVIVGVGLGLLLTWPLLENGLDYSELAGENMDMAGVSVSMVIYPAIDWVKTPIYAAVAIALTGLAALYPAIVAARLRPVDAMRHV